MKTTIENHPVRINIPQGQGLEMARKEKLKKVVAVAVAYYLKQQSCDSSSNIPSQYCFKDATNKTQLTPSNA